MPRLLFVLSQDYGELFNAMYFAAGGAFETVLLMPRRMHQANHATLPYACHAYENAAEIAAHVERFRSDAIVLFSGYLFVINKLLTEAELASLLSTWRARDIPLVTSDPSLGIIPRGAAQFPPQFAAAEAMRGHFRWLAEQFADVLHVYLAPKGIDGPQRRASYFNPSAKLDASDRARRANTLATWSAIEPGRPRWLFVLAPEDDALQAATLGRERFAEQVASRLRDAERAGRQAVLIAPSACLATVKERVGEMPGLITLSACGYFRFMLLLLDAEFVFYWNQFSASMLARVINRQPIFTFAPGHLVNALTEIRAVGTAHFYLGGEPTALDADEVLDAERLAELAETERRELLDPVADYLAQSPTPSEVVAQILKRA
jgi:hypothetical protein